MAAWVLVLALFWHHGASFTWPPSPTEPSVVRLDRAEVIGVLTRFRWRQDAAEWVYVRYPVYVWRRANYPEWAGLFVGDAVWLVSVTSVMSYDPIGLEHEMHHAWDGGHGRQVSEAPPDMERLGQEPTHAGRLALLILSAHSDDPGHLNHYLATALDYRMDELPAWYRERWFGYARGYRVVVPLVPKGH